MYYFATFHFLLVAIGHCLGTSPYRLKCASEEMFKGALNKTYGPRDQQQQSCDVHTFPAQCVEFKCSIGQCNDGLTLRLVRGCEKPDGDMDCDELTKQCVDAGGKPSQCKKCRGLTCNKQLKPIIACMSGRVDHTILCGPPQPFTARVCAEGDKCFTEECHDHWPDGHDNGTFIMSYTVKGCSGDKENADGPGGECQSPEITECAESCCNGREEEKRKCEALYATSSASSPTTVWTGEDGSTASKMSTMIGVSFKLFATMGIFMNCVAFNA